MPQASANAEAKRLGRPMRLMLPVTIYQKPDISRPAKGLKTLLQANAQRRIPTASRRRSGLARPDYPTDKGYDSPIRCKSRRIVIDV
ncbi:hypothetical protein MASR2M74_00270 [Paracoccaceae bacterium]